MHVYIYTYILIYICVHTYTYIHIFIFVHTYTNIHIYICVHTHTYIHIYIRIYIYTYIHIYICVHTYKNIHTTSRIWNGVATISRLLKMIGLFCKRALLKRRYSAKETYTHVYIHIQISTLQAEFRIIWGGHD